MREHFIGDLEGQIVAPDHVLGNRRKPQADSANPFGIHWRSLDGVELPGKRWNSTAAYRAVDGVTCGVRAVAFPGL